MKVLKTILLCGLIAGWISPCVEAAEIQVPADYTTIQAAIDAAVTGDEIVIADGVYTGDGNRDIELRGKAITVRSENGPENCIIDCQGTNTELHRGFYVHEWEDSTTVIQGLTILNGNTSSGSGGMMDNGAGIFGYNGSPKIENCVFQNNKSASGSGIYLIHYPVTQLSPDHTEDTPDKIEADIRNCHFENNTGRNSLNLSYVDGGIVENCIVINQHSENTVRGIEIGSSDVDVMNCRVTGLSNDSGQGVGFQISMSQGLYVNCVVDNSNIYANGGGVQIGGGSPILMNWLIANNHYGRSGGAVWLFDESSATILNCTVVENSFGLEGGGIDCHNSYPIFRNCIITDNSPSSIIETGYSILTITNSNIDGGYEGTGNIDSDPLFTWGPLGEYYLSQVSAGQQADSPCVNAGSEPAENVCYTVENLETCLDELTTRSDKGLDSATVDMGYHYLPEGTPPSPTPTPNVTQTPTASPTPTLGSGLELVLADTLLVPGDEFYLHYTLTNSSPSDYMADVWIVLEVFGEIWCYPSWTHINDGVDMEAMITVSANASVTRDVLQFIWPETSGNVSGMFFYGVACTAGTFDFIGEFQAIEWGYSDE